MTGSTGKFGFLNHKDTIAFLKVMLKELRKLTMRDGFGGVRSALDNAIKELKRVETAKEAQKTTPDKVEPD